MLNGARSRLAALGLGLSVSGCVVGPDFKSPEAPDVGRYTAQRISAAGGGAKGIKLELGDDIPERWWQTFHNKSLNKLVAASIARNPSLQAAEAGIRVAFHAAEAQKGIFLPNAAFGGSYSYNRQSGPSQALSPNGPSNPYSFYQKQIQVGFVPDIWGQNRRSVETLEAQTDQQRYQLEAAYLALTSNVAGAAVQEATLRAQIAAIQHIIKDERKLLEVLRREHAEGGVALTDVLAQEAQLAQALQLLPPLEKQLAQQRDLLTALAGEYSTNEIPETFQLGAFTMPHKVPVELPSQLVRQRPDVRAAEANMHAASAQIGVTIAAQLPNVNLSAVEGISGYTWAQMFGPGAQFYTLMGSVAQPLFDGFALRNKQRAAEAGLKQADALYRQAVLTSFQNVADALHALQADAKAVDAAAYSESVTAKNLDIVKKERLVGSVSILAVINAEQAYLQAVVSRVQAQGMRLSDVVSLFMALGGGWSDQNLKDLPPTTTAAPTEAQVSQINGPVNAGWFPTWPGH